MRSKTCGVTRSRSDGAWDWAFWADAVAAIVSHISAATTARNGPSVQARRQPAAKEYALAKLFARRGRSDQKAACRRRVSVLASYLCTDEHFDAGHCQRRRS